MIPSNAVIPVRRGFDKVSDAGQNALNHRAEGRIVINDQDGCHFRAVMSKYAVGVTQAVGATQTYAKNRREQTELFASVQILNQVSATAE